MRKQKNASDTTKGVIMHLSKTLIRQVSSIAHHYGQGWDGDDMNQSCLAELWELPDETSQAYALKTCHNLCIDYLREEERKAHGSTDDPAFFEPMIYGQIVDKEKYIRHIHDLRLRAIVDQYVDGESLSVKDRFYLYRHRHELDLNVAKYLIPVSPWMLLVKYCEPFKRTDAQLKEAPVF